jgi:hypothetical protein
LLGVFLMEVEDPPLVEQHPRGARGRAPSQVWSYDHSPCLTSR